MRKPATIVGLSAGILMVLLSVIFFYQLHLPVNGDNQLIILGTIVCATVTGQILQKQRLHAVSFKDSFSEGFKVFIIATLIMVIYTFVFYKFNPQILELAIQENNEIIRAEGNHTPIEIEANSAKLRNIFTPMMLSITTIKFIILGALTALITAGFLSTKQAQTGTQNN